MGSDNNNFSGAVSGRPKGKAAPKREATGRGATGTGEKTGTEQPVKPENAPHRRAALVDFGDELVSPTLKRRRVNDVFHSVASRYDVMNDVMSLGIHRLWKDTLMRMISPKRDQLLIDLAGGTGDIAGRFLAAGGGEALICDLNPSMMKEGQARADLAAYGSRLHWLAGDASRLPLATDLADIVTISFGLRNIADRDAALREALRVLKPGGVFFCLEFSHVRSRPLAAAYRLWSAVLPGIGAVIAGDAPSYRYLVESIRRFPDRETLSAMLGAAGFARVRCRDLSGGIAAIHRGLKK